MKMTLPWGATLWALLATGSPAAPALAQNVGGGGDSPRSGTVTPPGDRFATSPGGVDMRSGQYAYSQTDLSIGEDSEAGGLALTRLGRRDYASDNPFANFSHNWDITVTEKLININEGNYNCCGTDSRVSVHFGGRSDTFDRKATESYFTQASNNWRAQLTYTAVGSTVVYTYQATDGTIALFRPLAYFSGECAGIQLCAHVAQVTLPDGTRFSFEYDPLGTDHITRLRSVTSSRGYALLLQYGSGADANHVTASCVLNLALTVEPADNVCPGNPAAAASYAYTAFEGGRRLATAADATGAAWGFTYARVDGMLRMGFFRPGETYPWLINSLTERGNNDGVIEEITSVQTFADNATWTYIWDVAPLVDGEISQIAGGRYQDPAGHWTSVEYGFIPRPGSMNPRRVPQQGYPYVNYGDIYYQITPGPVTITDALDRTTTNNYCDPQIQALGPPNGGCLVTMLQWSVDPEGFRTDFTYDGYATRNIIRTRRRPRPGSTGVADIVTSAYFICTYAINCARPVTRTDANQNVTTYAYANEHGGLLRETGPAVNVVDPVTNAVTSVHPETRHEYAQRYPWIASVFGGYEHGLVPVWVRTASSTCRTTEPTGNPGAPCASATDEVRTTYDYGPDNGPNNLLLRGQVVTSTDNGVTTSLRTCYGYDARGRRISETQPNAQLTSCP